MKKMYFFASIILGIPIAINAQCLGFKQQEEITAHHVRSALNLTNFGNPIFGGLDYETESTLANFIPTAGATESFAPAVGDFFFDPGGPGGTDSEGGAGNYPNCGCTTKTTLDGVSKINFNYFSVFANFDYLRIYDGTNNTGVLLYNNGPGGAHDGDISLADMIASHGTSTFEANSGNFFFEFYASSVVDYGGWEVEIIEADGGGGEPGDSCDFDVPSNNFENGHGYINIATIAHDFQVQPSSTFTVNSFEFNTMETSPSTAVNLTIYQNNNGTPGNVVETLAGLTPTTTNIGTAFGLPVNKHVITFDTPKVFEGGADGATFWIGINVTNSGNAYWESTSVLGSTYSGLITADGGVSWAALTGTWDGNMKLSGTIVGECHGADPEPPAYTCDENFNNSNNFENGLFTGGADNQNLATDIIVGDTGFTVYGTKVNIFVSGNSDLNFSVNFYEDNAGLPGTLFHSTNTTVQESTMVGSAFGYDVYQYVVDFNDNAVLNANSTYWMEVITDNGIAWEATSASIFGEGLAFNNVGTGGAWTYQAGLDLVFELICGDDEPVDGCEFEVPSNNFENGHGYLELATVAHDFQVQPNSTFTVDGFEFNTMENNPSSSVTLTIYNDNNGNPGSVNRVIPGLVPTTTNIGTAFGFPVNHHEIVFTTPEVFEGGVDGTTYWIGITVTNSGNVYWESTSVLGSTYSGKSSSDGGVTWQALTGTWDGVMTLSGTIVGECHGEAPEPPAYTCEENFNNSNNFENGLFVGGNDNQKLATDLIVGDNGFTVYGVKANIFVDSNTNLTFNVNFYSDDNGLPGTPVHTTAGAIHESELIGSAFGYDIYEYTVDFDNNAVLNANTTYWMEIETNGIAWEATSSNIFGASLSFNNNATAGQWTNQPGLDLVFELVCEELGVTDLNSFDFAYYPNPVNDVLHIKAKKGVENVSIFNLAGQKVVNNAKVNNGEINVASLIPGTYVFHVNLEGGQVETFKIVKK